MGKKKCTKNMTKEELLKEPNKHASLVIRYKEESLYLDAMFMSQHCGLVRDFIYQKEGRLALDDDGGGSVDSGVFVDNLCFQEDDDDSAPKSKDEPAHAVKIRIPDGICTVSWAAIVEVVLLCYDPLYTSQDGCSLDSRPFEVDESESAAGEAAVDESESAASENAAGEAAESEKAEGEPALNDKYSLLKAAHFLQAHGISRIIEKSLIRFLDQYLEKDAPQVRMSFVPKKSVTTYVNVHDLVIREVSRRVNYTVDAVEKDFRIYVGHPEQKYWNMSLLSTLSNYQKDVPVKYPVPVARPAAILGNADERVKLCFVFADEFDLTEAWSTLIQIITEQRMEQSTVDFLKGIIRSSEYGSRISAKAQVEMLMALH